MPSSKTIHVMISSRCSDNIEYGGKQIPLSELRIKIKSMIEEQELFEHKAFDCWINEDAPPAAGDENSWEHCLSQVKKADIVIVLYNGNAGWCKQGGGIGICHAELQTALATGAAKVRLIELPITTGSVDQETTERNQLFQNFVSEQRLFRGSSARDGEKAIEVVKQALHDAVVEMVHLGGKEARKGKFDTGQALDWSRLNYIQRKAEIERVAVDSLSGACSVSTNDEALFVNIKGKHVLFRCHGIPAAMSVAAAREMIGRPFLNDYADSNLIAGRKYGPVHLICCHRTITENQAVNMLGFPDAIIVKTAFGVYVADNVQKIQMIFLSDCRDESSTRHSVQRFVDWLNSSGEATFLMERAISRSRIIRTIAKEAS